MTLGEKLIAFRLLKGHTQMDFCRAFNQKYPDTKIDRGFYSMIESDHRNMNIPTLKNLVTYYNTTADDLLFDDKIPEQLKPKKHVHGKNTVT
jgi:transcriptional regulator with XRE-family HTH domain